MKKFSLATIAVAFFLFLVWFVSLRQGVLLIIGLGMGAALAGARFGFTTGWRQLIEQGDPRNVLAQIFLLALTAAISIPLLGSYSELHAALGPPSIALLIGAFVFGMTMQIADGCGSGTLYKAGLGEPLNMVILPFFAIGSFLGSVHLDSWLKLGAIEPIGFVEAFGASKALLITLVLLGVFAFVLIRFTKVGPEKPWLNKKLWIGAAILAILANLNLLIAGQPWGVVYGFGLWAAKAFTHMGLFDPTTNWFWSQEGHAERITQSAFMDVTTITNLGILLGALIITSFSKAPRIPKKLSSKQWIIGILAGFLMGYSSRLAFGCNIGAMLSGISTGSLHGWIWVLMAFLGTTFGVRLRRHYGF
jgi:uncharacterized membrane protein YedE/YeeE